MSDLVARLLAFVEHPTAVTYNEQAAIIREAADALEAAEDALIEREGAWDQQHDRAEAAEADLKRAEERRGAAYLSAIERMDAAEARAEKAEQALATWQGLAENGTIVVAETQNPDFYEGELGRLGRDVERDVKPCSCVCHATGNADNHAHLCCANRTSAK